MYDVAVRAVNSKGMGFISNIETTAPNGIMEASSISDTLLPGDNEISRGIRKELSDLVCSEDEYYSLKDYINNM